MQNFFSFLVWSNFSEGNHPHKILVTINNLIKHLLKFQRLIVSIYSKTCNTDCVTLSSCRDITTVFPSFIFKSDAEIWGRKCVNLRSRLDAFCLRQIIGFFIAVNGNNRGNLWTDNRGGQNCTIPAAIPRSHRIFLFCMIERTLCKPTKHHICNIEFLDLITCIFT